MHGAMQSASMMHGPAYYEARGHVYGRAPIKFHHHLTDLKSCIVFAVGLAIFYAGAVYAMVEGNTQYLMHPVDKTGKFCGYTPAVSGKPYLYWCAKTDQAATDPAANLDIDMTNGGICVASCPTVDPQAVALGQAVKDPQCGTFNVNTVTFIDKYCIPTKTAGTDGQISDEFMASAEQLHEMAAAVAGAWPVYIAVLILSVVIGYVYLAALRMCAKAVIYIVSAASALGMTCLAVYFCFFGAATGEIPDSAETSELETQVAIRDKLASIVFLVMVCVVCCMLACCRRHFDMSAFCVECALEIVWSIPSLLLGPAIWSVAKAGMWIGLGYSFLNFYSTGDWVSDPAGLSPSFGWIQSFYLVFCAVFGAWMFGFITALYQYTVAHCVQDYYFTEREGFPLHGHEYRPVDCCEFLEGVAMGARYHGGSLALGSLLLFFGYPFASLLGFVFRRPSTSNPCILCLTSTLDLCRPCCTDWLLSRMTKCAYIEMAVKSKGFLDAGPGAIRIIDELGDQFSGLRGCAYVYQVIGTLFVTTFTGATSYYSFTLIPTFSDNTSSMFVGAPFGSALVCAIMSFAIAHSFMELFDVTADTLLYCYSVDRKQPETLGDFAPIALQDLLHYDLHEVGKQHALEDQMRNFDRH